MPRFLRIILLLFGTWHQSQAQFIENFSDGDFTNNPAWVGGTGDFIVNGS